MSGAVHIIGGGLSGLSAAVRLVLMGRAVEVHESAGHAGGRCRSFTDSVLGRRIDNGNHLLLSGNTSAMDYLDLIGAADSLAWPSNGAFPFLDLESGARWTVDPGPGLLPLWVFDPARRVPGTEPKDYLKALKLFRAGPNDTVAGVLDDDGELYRRFWEPLAVSVLNTQADQAAASLLWPVLRETFGRGGGACRPLIAREGLSESFIDPALKFLEARGAVVRFNRRLRKITFDGARVSELDFGDEQVLLGAADAAVLAVPPAQAGELVPELTVPGHNRAIVNGHFLLPETKDGITFLGLTGGVGHWLFVRGDVASVTVSAAEAIVDEPAEETAGRLWKEVSRALNLGDGPLPAYRMVKEKRATFAQTPEEIRRRPQARTRWPNLLLAGDWTATGLPATIEGAVRSGEIAARALRRTP